MRGISSLIDGAMEDSTRSIDENMILSSASEDDITTKKCAQNKATDNGTTKTKTATTRTKTTKENSTRKPAGKATSKKREAPEEQADEKSQPASKKSSAVVSARVGDEPDTILGTRDKQPHVKQKTKRKTKAKGPTDVEGDLSRSPTVARQSRPADAAKKQNTVLNPTVTNPQSPALEPNSIASTHAAASPHHPMKKVVPSSSRARHDGVRRRAGSASDTERAGGDPNLRRKLGDVTRKFENVDLRYHNLRDVGIVEANANMEKLRKQCEMTTSASNDLIASLKQELRMHMPLAQEARQLQVDVQNSRTEMNKHKSTITELEASLGSAQNEIKALQAKLAAARSSTATAEGGGAKTPGSAIKNSIQTRTVMVGSAEAAQSVQTAQLKEDLYSDLTGLIVRGVKRTEAGDAYDCIQTGRNGTLHFKLVVETEGDGRSTSFEEVEFLYTPLLDSNRDRDMIELLPYYLKEDITFSRHHAAKFYSRVADALMKKMDEG